MAVGAYSTDVGVGVTEGWGVALGRPGAEAEGLGVPGREAEGVAGAVAGTNALGSGDALRSGDTLGDGLGPR
jgi:hypothetical protein